MQNTETYSLLKDTPYTRLKEGDKVFTLNGTGEVVELRDINQFNMVVDRIICVKVPDWEGKPTRKHYDLRGYERGGPKYMPTLFPTLQDFKDYVAAL